MSTFMITYFLSDTLGHDHDDCGCNDNHSNSHEHENCGCGKDDTHSHKNTNVDINIIGKIKSLGAWAQFMPEGFLVKTNSSAEDIFNEVNSVTNKGDIIFVTKVDAKSSACANSAVLDWLSN